MYALCNWCACIHMNGPRIKASVYVYICTCEYIGWVHTKRQRCCNALCHAHIPVHNSVYGHARSVGTAASSGCICSRTRAQPANVTRARQWRALIRVTVLVARGVVLIRRPSATGRMCDCVFVSAGHGKRRCRWCARNTFTLTV
jgi:hypothetical protein